MEQPTSKLSKNELKRRLKAERKSKQKANKIEPEKPNEMQMVDLPNLALKNFSQLQSQKFYVSTSLEDFVENYSSLKDGEMLDDVSLSVAGRVHAIRKSGAKLIFCDLRSISVKLQVMADARLYGRVGDFATDTVNLLRGDIIGINGYPGRTKKGELSVIPRKITQLYNLATLFTLEPVSQ